MRNKSRVTIYTDGASRGNPGPSAFGYVLKRDSEADIENKGCLEDTTNNIAEYTALIKALQHARDIGAGDVDICTDSELMVKQIKGIYKVKNDNLKPLHRAILELRDQFDSFAIRHIPRAENARADKLCNQALDAANPGGKKKAASTSTSKKKKAQKADVREDAIMCLTDVAKMWALGDPGDPKPAEVWDQLWSILQDGGVLK